MLHCHFAAGIYLLKVNNRNTRTRCEIYSKLRIKTLELRQWRRFGVFILNFEHTSQLVLVVLLLALNMQLPFGFPLAGSILNMILCADNYLVKFQLHFDDPMEYRNLVFFRAVQMSLQRMFKYL